MIVMNLEFGIAAIVTIFAIVNPVGNIPFFVTVTDGYPKELRKKVIIKICLVMVSVLFIFGLFGDFIFQIYGITIPAFRIAGGALLFTVALSMMQGRPISSKITETEKAEALEKDQVGIVPLGIPMFAGPGAITTVMILVSGFSKTGEYAGYLWVLTGVLLTAAVTYIILSHSELIYRVMGRSGTMAFSRIMGLVLAAVAVQFILEGIFQAVRDSGLV